jgi:hypothetical protein
MRVDGCDAEIEPMHTDSDVPVDPAEEARGE